MKRVVKPSGYICIKDGELSSRIIFPTEYAAPFVEYEKDLRNNVTAVNGGSRLKSLGLDVGYKPDNIAMSISNWCISTNQDRHWFAGMFMNRLKDSNIEDFKKERLLKAWKDWADDERSICVLVHFEMILCAK